MQNEKAPFFDSFKLSLSDFGVQKGHTASYIVVGYQYNRTEIKLCNSSVSVHLPSLFFLKKSQSLKKYCQEGYIYDEFS